MNVAGFTVAAPAQLADPSPLLCDNIDPETRDFASLTTGADPIDSQVEIALSRVRNSGPSVVYDGSRIREVKKMDDNAQDQARSLVKEALSRLVANRDIRHVGTTFDLWEVGSQSGQLRVQYVNLRAGNDLVRSVTLTMFGG